MYTSPATEVRDLKTYFSTGEGIVKAVDGVSLSIPEGKTLALVGESGCGKSVTALSIMRLLPPNGRIVKGEIRVNGQDILKLDKKEMAKIRGDKIAMIFQDPMSSLNPVYTVGDQIMETIMLHRKVTKREAKDLATEIVDKVRIPDPRNRLDEYPYQMSGGMRQRIMIAIALVCNPLLLIADEPTTALDVTTQAQILDLMRNLRDEFKTSIFFISHDLGVVAEIADFVAVMYASKIVEYASVHELYKNPKHPYTIALFGALPKLDDRKNRSFKAIPGSVPSLQDMPNGCKFHPRCSYVKEDCKLIEPELKMVSDGHQVACLKYE